MRVASNKLKDIINFYHVELGLFYNSSEIDAIVRVTLNHFLGFSPTDIISKLKSNVNQSDLIKLYDCCKLLSKQLPLQYVLGEIWFYNLRFKVNSNVLIPRPETEELVDIIVKENSLANSFLDVGSGSGCIPISIKKAIPMAVVYGCDISDETLALATENALLNNADVLFFKTDVLDTSNFEKSLQVPVDVIVSNPPYIKISEKATSSKQVINHEPHLALFVEGNDDIVFYKNIIDASKTLLNKNGHLYFELNPLTANDVKLYATNSGLFKYAEIIKDMSGNNRFFKAVKH